MRAKLVVDLSEGPRLGAGMDQDDIDLLVALCTRIGAIMEDASVIA
jgi:hypothetical protein